NVGGLLGGFTRPLGGTSTFSYDTLGRLIEDDGPGPDGAATKLARTDLPSGHTVVVTTALGRTTTHQVEYLPTGELRRTTIDARGLKTVTLTRTDGSQQVTSPDGSMVETVPGPDPRWGMQAPLTVRQTQTSAQGLRSVTLVTRTATLADPSNPLSLA